jgi:Uma2 family endonuclease
LAPAFSLTPNIAIVSGQPQLLDQHGDVLLNPSLILEVLSPSTEAYDRTRKFDHYATLESLREYVLVGSDRVSVEVLTRQPGGKWLLSKAVHLEDSVEFQSIACRLSLAELYENIEFPSRGAEAWG